MKNIHIGFWAGPKPQDNNSIFACSGYKGRLFEHYVFGGFHHEVWLWRFWVMWDN